MALECSLHTELELPVPFTVADGAGIEKGSVMEISDPNTVAVTNGDDDKIIGIAAEEKIASDGKTKLGVYMRGIFRGYAGAAGVTVGRAIISDTATGAANELVIADANSEGIIGTALETATDGQTFLFLLNPINPRLA
tara:strand:- start:51 stop:464 length:414 start_codon:yes stop_codon:yes gene_type:complete